VNSNKVVKVFWLETSSTLNWVLIFTQNIMLANYLICKVPGQKCRDKTTDFNLILLLFFTVQFKVGSQAGKKYTSPEKSNIYISSPFLAYLNLLYAINFKIDKKSLNWSCLF
jgi:hypothetical protein